MSRMVWSTTVVVGVLAAVLAAAAGPASAQYRGYGYDYDSGPNYFQNSPAYDPFYQERPPYPDDRRGYGYPDDRRGPPPDAAYGYDRDQTPYGPDPGYGGREPGRAASDYDLGESANQRTMTEVPNPTREPPGTIVIDTATRHLYLVEKGGQALQYGIGVGREGFEWKGTAHVQRKAEWPGWTPPAEMLKRRPDLPVHMDGGIENPLGARALYLFNGKGDTGFRIHGTNEPETIGKAVSSGCIRMMNADVIDLYQRVPVGTRVVVL